MSYSNNSSIKFPPGTITSKLSSRLLKKPPSPKDWMHQTYMQMIQDVSYATSHYYESTENGTGLLLGTSSNKVTPESGSTIKLSETNSDQKNATLPLSHHHYNNDDDTRNIIPSTTSPINKSNTSSPLSLYEYHNNYNNTDEEDINNKNGSEDEEEDDDDDQSEFCHTYTTSSTDCNRRNNIYRFYREQQSLNRPIDEEEPSVIKIVTPFSSNYNISDEDDISSDNNSSQPNINIVDNSSSFNNIMVTKEQQDIKVNQQQQQQRKKKFKLFKSMMTKMKMAAEKPFWAIDSHF